MDAFVYVDEFDDGSEEMCVAVVDTSGSTVTIRLQDFLLLHHLEAFDSEAYHHVMDAARLLADRTPHEGLDA